MKIRELREQGLSVSAIAVRLELDRKTVRKALRETQPPTRPTPRTRQGLLEPFHEYLRGRLQQYPELSAIRLLDEVRKDGYEGGYTILKQAVADVKQTQTVRAIVRFETQPGGQGQVDWAHFGKIVIDGAERKLYQFTYVLGWSRTRYVEYTLDQALPTLLQCLLNAFEYCNGYPRELLFDNMKQVILKASESKDKRTWNPMFTDFMHHFGITPRLCRPYRAQTKGKVENTVKFGRYGFFEGRAFTSLQDMNNQARAWCDEIQRRIHGTTHERPIDRLPLENLNQLADKPPYIVTLSFARKISRECFVSYHGNKYSVPWKHAGRACTVRIRQGRILIEAGGRTVAEHGLVAGSHQVVRLKEHFEGLLKAIRAKTPQPGRTLVFPDEPVVERRQLEEYERALDEFVEASQ
jgi:transposase